VTGSVATAPVPGLARRCAAEAVGTFALVFAGTGAIVVDTVSGGAVTHVGIAAAFGLVVMTMIYALGDVSGAHMNPAVSAAFCLAGRFPGRDLIPYAASQCGGALAASLLLAGLFPGTELGVTRPVAGVGPALAFELALTAMLMLVILGVSTGAREKGLTAGIAVGGCVALAALVGGPVSGASMNPARTLGPALASGDLAGLWIYLLAPVAGAALAVIGCRCIRASGCCTQGAEPVS
jgi:aquaporin Z